MAQTTLMKAPDSRFSGAIWGSAHVRTVLFAHGHEQLRGLLNLAELNTNFTAAKQFCQGKFNKEYCYRDADMGKRTRTDNQTIRFIRVSDGRAQYPAAKHLPRKIF
jgi:hypothetical protein